MSQTLVTVTEPQTYLDTAVSSTPSPGTAHYPSGSDDLQTILDSVNAGDIIYLSPGTTYTGNFTISAKSGASASNWVTVMALGTLPAEGTRMTPAQAASLPVIRTGNTVQCLT